MSNLKAIVCDMGFLCLTLVGTHQKPFILLSYVVAFPKIAIALLPFIVTYGCDIESSFGMITQLISIDIECC